MEPQRIAILAGTGKTGKAVAAALEARDTEPRPLDRAAYDDLSTALSSCTAVYLIAPNLHPDEPGLVRTALDGMSSADIDRVVYHSVAAPYEPSMPHHRGKAESERLIRTSGVRWTILQPCAYMQNLIPLIDPDADEPTLAVPYDLHRPFGLVDLADVGEAAATVLLDDTHVGATYELGGPALVGVADVAAAASEVLGRPVRAVKTPIPGDAHPWLAAMFTYYDHHGLPAAPVALQALLGRDLNGIREVLERELRRSRASRVRPERPRPPAAASDPSAEL